MPSQPVLFLIDGHALAYRTYFALTGIGDGSRWTTTRGEATAGTYGFTSVLLRLIEQEKPEYLAVSFDTGRTFRDDLYAEYKATREKMPDDLRSQLERIREVVEAFEIPIFEAEGFEADDVLGTVANQAAEHGVRVIILTGDRDLLQLADENVVIRLAGRRLADADDFGPQEVHEKLGVRPEQVADYKAIVGDSSDNIPGVRGVGEKTALTLLQEHPTLEDIYENLDSVPTRFRTKLEESREQAFLSRQLARIVTDVDVPFELESCRLQGFNRERVVELFRTLEFRSLLDRLPGEAAASGLQMNLFGEETGPIQAEGVPDNVVTVNDTETLANLSERLSKAKEIALDVETTSTDALRADLVGISLAIEPGEGFYLPVGHRVEIAGDEQLDLESVLEALRGPLTAAGIPKVGHNLKYDYLVLARHGLAATPLGFDTMLAEWLCDPASRNLGLKNLAWVRLGAEMIQIEELIGRGQGQRSMAEVPIQQVAPYAAADAEVCLRLKPILEKELEQKQQTALFHDLEMPLVSVLAQMELDGVGLDLEVLRQIAADLSQRLHEIEKTIYDTVGHSFNLNSTQQLSTVLFDELGLEPPDRTRKTASGHYSTAASVLEELRPVHPIVDLVLENREIAKIKSTYADALQNQVNPATGRVHSSFSQTGSVTGRLASSDPNLQNIPVRSEVGRQIRQAFVAAKDHLLLAVDYSQIELRILAHICEDAAMIEAFEQDQDIHATTAAAVFNVEMDEVTAELRRRAKAVNFGLIYGMSAFGLTRSTDLTLAEAEDFVAAYFDRFPGVKRYLDKTKAQAREEGFVETLLGRRRYFPQLTRGAKPVPEVARARALREAINAPIQGSAADIIKLAMLRLPPAFEASGLSARMLLQVHDELLFETRKDELESTLAQVRDIMENAYQLRVPLKTDAKAGKDWYRMETVG